jgi:hypothetical protein
MQSHSLTKADAETHSEAANQLHAALYTALNKILRPIIRILLRNGIAYGQFAELTRKIFVDVAAEDFPGKGNRPTITHIAALTGLTRKQVKKMVDSSSDNSPDPEKKYNRATRIISAWLQDAQYQDAQGLPARLHITAGAASFAGLVKTYSGDMTVQCMLNILETSGTVKRDGDNVELIRNAYIPAGDPIDKITILGNDVRELLQTIDHNLAAESNNLRFQRKASNRISADGALEVHKLVRVKAQALLEEIDGTLTEHEYNSNSTEAGPGKTVSVGIYYYESDSPEQQ